MFNDAEWEVFATGLDLLRDSIETDIASESDDSETGVGVFDRLTAEQKLGLLADVASALRDPDVPAHRLTATNEGAIMAVMVTFEEMLRSEIEANEKGRMALRETLLAAVADDEDRPEKPPKPTARKWEAWETIFECYQDRVLWDYDFEMGDEFLDQPPDVARAMLDEMRIDPDYYLDTPPEPGQKGLIVARQTLARLLGLAVPDDDGLFPALVDRYHDLFVGPVTPAEIAMWEENPWVQAVFSTAPDWECDFSTWVSEFRDAVPTTPFEVSPAAPGDRYELPPGVRVEPFREGWAVRDGKGSYWCDLLVDCWTDDLDDDEDDAVLSFPTENDAKAAYLQASKMFDERLVRQKAAYARLGIEE